jgi:hypothetical protein
MNVYFLFLLKGNPICKENADRGLEDLWSTISLPWRLWKSGKKVLEEIMKLKCRPTTFLKKNIVCDTLGRRKGANKVSLNITWEGGWQKCNLIIWSFHGEEKCHQMSHRGRGGRGLKSADVTNLTYGKN